MELCAWEPQHTSVPRDNLPLLDGGPGITGWIRNHDEASCSVACFRRTWKNKCRSFSCSFQPRGFIRAHLSLQAEGRSPRHSFALDVAVGCLAFTKNPRKESESVVAQSCLILCDPVGFSRQEYWSGLPFPSPGDLPDPGIEPRSPALQVDSLLSEPPGKSP